jgi:hypothetical protein
MLAIARVATAGGSGTAFAVSAETALTAFHVVGDRTTGAVTHPRVMLVFREGKVPATVVAGETAGDVALLHLTGPMPPGCDPVALTDELARGEWHTRGFPVAGAGEVSVDGTIVDPDACLPGTEVPAVQLFCRQAAAESPQVLKGFSGAPVLVGEPPRAVGVVRWNPTEPDKPRVAVGGSVYACPAAVAVARWPELLLPLTRRRSVEQRHRRLAELLRRPPVQNGRLPAVAEVDPHEVGASPTRYSIEGRASYVPRPGQDRRLRSLLTAEPVVLVVGPATSGKSRTAYEAAAAVWGEAGFVQPKARPYAVRDLLDLDADAPLDPGRLLIWLDDLDDYLAEAGGLDVTTLQRAADRVPPAVVVATIRDEGHRQLRQSRGESGATARAVLQLAERGRVDLPREPTPEERTAARLSYPEEDFSDPHLGVAERLVSAPELLDRFLAAKDNNPHGWAVVKVAIDWQRVGLTRPVPRSGLRRLYEYELIETHPHLDPTDTDFAAGLTWARRPAVSRVAQLTTRRDPDGTQSYQAVEYLEDHATSQRWVVPDAVWHSAMDLVSVEELLAMGRQAEIAFARPDIAEAAWRRAAEAGHPDAMTNLAALLDRLGRIVEVERWYRRAAEAGHPGGMYNLGLLRFERGDAESLREAEQWWRTAAQAGDPGALYSLSVLLQRRGDEESLREAEWWSQRAAEAAGGRVFPKPAEPVHAAEAVIEFSGDVTDLQKQMLTAALRGFMAHLESLHVPLGAVPTIHIKSGARIAYPDPSRGRLFLGAPLADDPGTVLHEYSHWVLEQIAGVTRGSWTADVRAIEAGLAYYLPCSVTNDPRGMYFDLSSTMGTPDYIAKYLDDAHLAGLRWAGALWEVRDRLGRETLDGQLLATWGATPTTREDRADFAERLCDRLAVGLGPSSSQFVRAALVRRELLGS